MQRLLSLATVLWLALVPVTTAQEARDTAIEKTISRQIEAFLADDVETAFSFAAPNIKALFGTPERFGQMVRQGYPMVWRPAMVSFLDLELTDEGWVQRVLFEDQRGRYFVGRYFMVETPDGWQIRAVHIEKANAAAA